MTHDEYTDYSCSTSIERLARDVETHLRSWHLANSDRHVSFAHELYSFDHGTRARLSNMVRDDSCISRSNSSLNLAGAAAAAATTESLSMRAGTIETSTRRAHDDSDALRSSYQHHHLMGRNSSLNEDETQLIRSEEVEWVVSLADGGKASVPLILALWDGRSREDFHNLDLPQSLRRVPLHAMPADPFANFSALFGIGQHLTLSLKNLSVSPDVEWALGRSVVERHDEKVMAHWLITSSLSSILQTALQCSISNILCRIPAFGVWGVYQPNNDIKPTWGLRKRGLYPSWLSPCESVPARKRAGIFERKKHLNRTFLPPVLTANLLGGSKFWVTVLPSRDSSNRLTVWGQLLLQHSATRSVLLCGAKHTYTWRKQNKLNLSSRLFGTKRVEEWRHNSVITLEEITADDMANYQLECCHYAVSLLELASSVSSDEPLWGPPDDPIKAVHVTATWNGKKGDPGKPLSLLTMPLRIRSRRSMSRRDWIDMEESVERTILDPLSPSKFVIQTQYDRTVDMTPLAARQRCMLACLVRSATLPHTMMLPELTDGAGVGSWGSSETELAAMYLVEHSRVSITTMQLVQAMDWATLADEMIEEWEVNFLVQKAMNGVACLGFPSPPEELFGPEGVREGPFDCLPKSAPPGRLLSVLFFEMSKLRSPSAMAQVWLSFVTDLRDKWDSRDSLPNMIYVPGLDKPPDETARTQNFSTISLKADNAAFLNSSEPDPGEDNCLIGQKLQVFNIGIELAVAQELRESERLESMVQRQQELSPALDDPNDNSCGVSVASTEQMNNIGAPDATRVTSETHSPSPDDEDGTTREDLQNTFQRLADEYPRDEAGDGSLSSGSSKVEFHDARSLMSGSIAAELEIRDPLTNVAQRQNRKGARCPVPGVNLVASGDQLYAPYLQRPAPLTDDIILDRHNMMTRQRQLGTTHNVSTQYRMEIAHRLQKPKLLSDMRAFQAANPGAVFQDFIAWYGNPGNPLEEYGGMEDEDLADATESSVALKLDRASQAIQVLNSTRDFWSDTWDIATPCAAADQDPLFEPSATVEMVLDHLETLHPANLLNQVMAVNLSMSYFILLASAGDAILVVAVSQAMERLRMRTTRALDLLSRDAVYGSSAQEEEFSKERLPRHASIEAIQACDGACDALSEAETMLARAMSLLHKFPQKYDLVHNILRRADSDSIPLSHPRGRASILEAIRKQQGEDGADRLPKPSVREYVLRNTDEGSPCQLCVRFGEEDAFDDDEGGLMIALTKTNVRDFE